MNGLMLLVLLFIIGGKKSGAPAVATTPPAATTPPVQEAADAAAQAARTQAPADAARAAQASTAVTTTARTQSAAQAAPRPFPQARPSGLPPFPGPSWKSATPPNSAIVTRANQLLPVLWGRGVGSTQVELTRGEWITYLAQFMNPQQTIKGVTAWRLRDPSLGPAPNA